MSRIFLAAFLSIIALSGQALAASERLSQAGSVDGWNWRITSSGFEIENEQASLDLQTLSEKIDPHTQKLKVIALLSEPHLAEAKAAIGQARKAYKKERQQAENTNKNCEANSDWSFK